MKNIILITAASTLLLASGAWGGVAPPVEIDFDDGECYVFGEDRNEPIWVGAKINRKLLEKEKDGITEIIATCSGNEQALITDGSFKKPIHFDKNTVPNDNDCVIRPEEGPDEWTSEWHQVLRKNGGFSLKCIKVVGP